MSSNPRDTAFWRHRRRVECHLTSGHIAGVANQELRTPGRRREAISRPVARMTSPLGAPDKRGPLCARPFLCRCPVPRVLERSRRGRVPRPTSAGRGRARLDAAASGNARPRTRRGASLKASHKRRWRMPRAADNAREVARRAGRHNRRPSARTGAPYRSPRQRGGVPPNAGCVTFVSSRATANRAE